LPEKIVVDKTAPVCILVNMEVQAMDRERYTNKKGEIRYRPLLTLEEAEELMVDGDLRGWCLGCGEEQRSEPDARRSHCESCKSMLVYGIEELMLMGLVKVDGEVVR
jgi:hypothetical protein